MYSFLPISSFITHHHRSSPWQNCTTHPLLSEQAVVSQSSVSQKLYSFLQNLSETGQFVQDKWPTCNKSSGNRCVVNISFPWTHFQFWNNIWGLVSCSPLWIKLYSTNCIFCRVKYIFHPCTKCSQVSLLFLSNSGKRQIDAVNILLGWLHVIFVCHWVFGVRMREKLMFFVNVVDVVQYSEHKHFFHETKCLWSTVHVNSQLLNWSNKIWKPALVLSKRNEDIYMLCFVQKCIC